MSFGKDTIKSVNALFEKRADEAKRAVAQRKESLYIKLPRLQQIEYGLSENMGQLVSSAANGSLSADRINTIKKENEALLLSRSAILVEAGLSADYLDLKYTCEKCADIGYIGSSMCQCYLDELKKESFSRSFLAQAMPEAAFENFQLDFYSSSSSDGGISPKELMEFNLEICKNFAYEFDSQKTGLLLSGPTGLGKTFLSGCISRVLTEGGRHVIYDTAYGIFSKFEVEKFHEREERGTTNEYFECDLLIIDDLASELVTSFTVSALYNLVNARLLTKKLTIISTNLSLKDLEKTYPQRIISRLMGSMRYLEFKGDDIRMARALLSFNQF